jgi:hypothetical protein
MTDLADCITRLKATVDELTKSETDRARIIEALVKVTLTKQVPRSLRRNGLPTKRINGALLMCHEHPAGALVELCTGAAGVHS